MVRKRAYKEESDESDSDYEPVSNDSEPKRYSLRKRTRQALTEDFNYDVDSELSSRHPSDDEEFILDEDNANHGVPYVSYVQPVIGEVPESSQADNGLIDFEDIIRADIVINKNKINLDTGLDKVDAKTTKRRGRPPKYKPIIEEFSHSILGPLADVYTSIDAVDLLETSVDETDEPHIPSVAGADTVDDSVLNVNTVEPVTEITENVENDTCSTTGKQEKVQEEIVSNKQKLTEEESQEIDLVALRDSDKTQNITDSKERIGSSLKSEIIEQELKTASEVSDYVEEEDDVILIQNNTEIVVLDD